MSNRIKLYCDDIIYSNPQKQNKTQLIVYSHLIRFGTLGLDVRIKIMRTVQNFYASDLNLSTKLHIIELTAAAKAGLYIFFLKEGRVVLTELYIMES